MRFYFAEFLYQCLNLGGVVGSSCLADFCFESVLFCFKGALFCFEGLLQSLFVCVKILANAFGELAYIFSFGFLALNNTGGFGNVCLKPGLCYFQSFRIYTFRFQDNLNLGDTLGGKINLEMRFAFRVESEKFPQRLADLINKVKSAFRGKSRVWQRHRLMSKSQNGDKK